ncbi:chemerin-like receptor 1 [Ctenodactylus gundi]
MGTCSSFFEPELRDTNIEPPGASVPVSVCGACVSQGRELWNTRGFQAEPQVHFPDVASCVEDRLAKDPYWNASDTTTVNGESCGLNPCFQGDQWPQTVWEPRMEVDYSNYVTGDYNNSVSEDYLDEYDLIMEAEDSLPPETRAFRIFLVVVYSIICFLGILGNGLVIVIATFKMKRTVNTVLFLNLAVADFLFNIFLPIYIAYVAMDYHWVFGTAMCKVSNFLLTHNMYTSVFLLTIISFDRCVSVILPVWAQNHRSIRLAYMVCVAIWVLAFFLSTPSLIFRDTAERHGKIACFNNFNLSVHGSAHFQLDSVGYSRLVVVTVIRFLCGFLVPVLIITACYLTIVCKLQRNRLAKTKKPFKVIITIVATFFLCWCPYHTFYLLELLHTAMPASVFSLGLPVATAVAIANSCMNPILYVFMGQDFKKFKVAFFSRLVNALSEDTGHSSFQSHRSFTKMSSMNEKTSVNEKETSLL